MRGRKLHPDRIGQTEEVCKAVEKVREARPDFERLGFWVCCHNIYTIMIIIR